nr:xylulose kinase-1 [Tanacetum cinerariifolium]
MSGDQGQPILNGNRKKSLGRDSKGGIIILHLVSFEEHVAVQRETKARILLLQSLPEDHMVDFHHLDDAREIWLAVKARFGGNEESKKMRKTMLKQEFSEFSVFEEEGLHKGYDRALPLSWSQVALTLKTRGGLEYLSFDDLYNKLRSHEIDVKDGSSYGLRGTIAAPTHSAFIGAASTNTKMVYSDQPSHSSLITYTSAHSGSIIECNVKKVDEKARYSAGEPKAMVSVDSMLNWNEHEAENKTEKDEQVYGLMVGFKSDFADHAGNAAGSVSDAATEFAMMGISPKYSKTLYDQAKIEKKEWEVKLTESLARFDKWKESFIHLAKLINSSMSTRTKLGLRVKEYIGSDEVFDLSIPSVFDPEPENKEVKSLYERFVKAGEMHEVPQSITGTFMPTSYKSDLEETQVTFGLKSNTSSINSSESNEFISCNNSNKSSESKTYDFASCVSSPKTNDSFSTVDVKILPKSDVKDPSPTNGFPSCSFKENVKPPRNYDCDEYNNVDNFPSIVWKAAFVPAGSRNSLASISAGRSIPAARRNRPASIHAGRHIPASRFTKTTHFPAGRYVPTGIVDSGCSIPRSMLRHGLEVPKLLVEGDLSMAEQLVYFIKVSLLNAQSTV